VGGLVPFQDRSLVWVACLLDPSLPIMIKNLEDKIRDLLIKHPETRDNDQMLVSLTWFYHIGRDEVKSLSAWDLLTKLSKNKLPNAESIRRCRQKLQEHDEDLRGKKYKERHKLECEVKEEIKNWTGELF